MGGLLLFAGENITRTFDAHPFSFPGGNSVKYLLTSETGEEDGNCIPGRYVLMVMAV